MNTAVASVAALEAGPESSSTLAPVSTRGGFGRRQLALILAWSVLILIPCWWQPHIQAVDLPSHLYNAWLANQVSNHAVPGLSLMRQSTNILFDLMLRGLLHLGSPEMAERIAVSVAVLIFFWGAFAFVGAVSNGCRWSMAPCLAMLAYGWVFHMGFFNFYLSMGLCLSAMAIVWRPGWKRWVIALVMLAAACDAHAMPVAWAVSVITYLYVSRRCSGLTRKLLPAAALLALIAGLVILHRAYFSVWSLQQLSGLIGIDQVWMFGRKYYLLSMGLLLVWTFLLTRLGTTHAIPLDLVALNCLAVALIPTHLELPFYRSPLNFIEPRMSLTTALLICALLGAGASLRHGIAFSVLAALFFSFVFVDTREMNRIEARVDLALSAVPAGSRVINGVQGLTNRMLLLTHNVDRACIGRCYSYGNYEPSTGQFSLRATAPNPVVLSDPIDIGDVQEGRYVVQQRDLPLFQVTLCGQENRICAHSMSAGERTRVIKADILPPLWASRDLRVVTLP